MLEDRRDERKRLRRAHEYRGEAVVSIDPLPTADAWSTRAECATARREWIDFLQQPSAITDLALGRANDDVLAALRGQAGLERLSIHSGPFTQLSHIGSLSRLVALRIDATRVQDVSPLTALISLRELAIENGLRLRDYSPLGRIASLRSLRVVPGASEARTDADSVDFLADLHALEELRWHPRVTSRDFTALLSLTSAASIRITETKGMSPSLLDLEWALPGMQAAVEQSARQRASWLAALDDSGIGRTDTSTEVVEIDDIADAEPDERPTGLVSGTTLRAFAVTPRTRKEVFLVHVDGWSDDLALEVSPDQRELGRFAFAGPAEGPLLVWDSAVDESISPGAFRDYFDGNVDVPALDNLPEEPDYPWDSPEPNLRRPWLWGVRVLVRASGSIREWVVLVNMPNLIKPCWKAAATDAVAKLGGEIVAGPELAVTPLGALGRSPEAFTIRRRSTRPAEAYVARYGFRLSD